MTKTSERVGSPTTLVALAVCALVACGQTQPRAQASFDPTTQDVVQWKLPKRLAEISGLALSSDGRLFAHDDEQAIVYQIDPQRGKLVKAFALGKPVVRGDFEGIALADTDFYLVTSNGRLYRSAEGADGEHVTYDVTDTGLGARCEIEGLAYDPRRKVILVSCKTPRIASLDGWVGIFAWSIQRREVDQSAAIRVSESALADPIGARRFNPSAIEITHDGAHIWLLAGRQRALAAIDLDGGVNWVTLLPATRHRQPEGLALSSNGELIIADEARHGRAKLAIYRTR